MTAMKLLLRILIPAAALGVAHLLVSGIQLPGHSDWKKAGTLILVALLTLYIVLGIFLVIAVRNPSAHRSLIAYTAWSSFAHALVMSVLAFGPSYVNDRAGYWGGSAVLVAIGVALLVLSPAKALRESVSGTAS